MALLYRSMSAHGNRQSGDSSNTIASRSRSPLKFFSLVFALSIPFWLFGALTRLQLLPGLPVSSLMAVCPLMAASILVYGENETAGVIELLNRSFDYKRIRAKVWYAPIVLLMPGVTVMTYGLMRVMGVPLPTPQFPVLAALAMFVAFFVVALGEELGWSGYALDPLQDRWNALQASILLGVGMGHVAHRPASAGSSTSGMDRLVVSLHDSIMDSYDLAL
jgi:CAAX protease family protein